MRPALELAQIIERFGKEFESRHSPNTYVWRTLDALRRCRTSSLGGHVDRCDQCGHIRISYNSCRNRHCPKCQNTQREAWIENRIQDLLPVPYFHVVFTIPDKLNDLFLQNRSCLYNLIFRAAWQTLSQFCFIKLQAETGMVAVLHTWGQNLSFHPHIHCVIPGGGINYKGQWKEIKQSRNGKVFLFRAENISAVFRGKFIEAVKKQLPLDKRFIRQLYKTPWVIYFKEPFAGPQQVIDYLGRYTHRVAITNHRLLAINQNSVRFRYRDYRDNRQKVMTLDGIEFLRRFSQHILPKGFVRIRHFGLMATSKRDQLRKLQQAFNITVPVAKEKKDWKQICIDHLNFNPDLCPHCAKGKMIAIDVFRPGRAPPSFSRSFPQTEIENVSIH